MQDVRLNLSGKMEEKGTGRICWESIENGPAEKKERGEPWLRLTIFNI